MISIQQIIKEVTTSPPQALFRQKLEEELQQVMCFYMIFKENHKSTYKRAAVRRNQRTLLSKPQIRDRSKCFPGIV